MQRTACEERQNHARPDPVEVSTTNKNIKMHTAVTMKSTAREYKAPRCTSARDNETMSTKRANGADCKPTNMPWEKP